MRNTDEPAVSYPRLPGSGSSVEPLENRSEGSISITLRADSASFEILRSVIGRAARIAGFSYDGIEDFAMAVDEAAMLLIESSPRDLLLNLSGMHPSGRLEVLVTARDPTKALSLDELRAGYRWDVLCALCEQVWWHEAGVSIGLAQSTR